MVTYPASLPKPLYKGHANNPSQDFLVTEMDYASKRRSSYYGIFKIPLTFKFSGQEFNDFNSWYYGDSATQMARGAKVFTAYWEVLGVTSLYEFAFTKGGQPKTKPLSPDSFEVKCEVELKTDIFEIIALNNLDGFCPDIIDCQNTMIAWAISA